MPIPGDKVEEFKKLFQEGVLGEKQWKSFIYKGRRTTIYAVDSLSKRINLTNTAKIGCEFSNGERFFVTYEMALQQFSIPERLNVQRLKELLKKPVSA